MERRRGSDAGQLDKLVAEVFESAMEHGLLEDAVISTSEGQAEAFWQIRDSISAAERAKSLHVMHQREREAHSAAAVSYTHLTLPTILLV